MLLQRPTLYIGLMDGMPAYTASTKDFLVCKLFRDPKMARREFMEIARVEIEPTIKLVTIERWDYAELAGKIKVMQTQLSQLRDLRTSWWITERVQKAMKWIRRQMERLPWRK